MSSNMKGTPEQTDLRLRALQRLTLPTRSYDTRLNASAALGVLYELASSPSTATAALTLLHELQVHQVELDLQEEELRRSRAALEANLSRQVQLYDFAPAACFTVDQSSKMIELNLTAARMLGSERDYLLGQSLDSFLTPLSAKTLQAMLARLGDGAPTQADTLQLATIHGVARRMHVCANRDTDNVHILIAFIDVAENEGKI